MPVPKGYTLDQPQVKLPTGYTLDAAAPDPTPGSGTVNGVQLPSFPTTPQPNMQAAPTLTGGDLAGNTASVVGTHLKNFVAGPYHAFTDAPQTPQEQAVKGTKPDSGMAANALGQFGLGAYRMMVQPTIENSKKAVSLYKAGDTSGAANAAMDAIPLAGPWARNIENDAAQKGVIPALAGLATDVYAPGAIAKGSGMLVKPLARSAAIGDVTRMIKPNATDTSFAKSPAEGILSQPGGAFSTSKEALLDRSKQNLGLYGKQIAATVANSPQNPMDISGTVLKPFDSSLNDAAQSNQGSLYGRLQETKKGLTTDLYHDPATDSIQQQMGPKNLTAVTPNNVFALKKQVGSNIKWTNQAFDDDLNATQGKVYGGLKDSLNTAIPEVKPLNEKYANLRSGINALERRIPIEARNNAISLPDATLGAGAAAAGGALPAAAALAGKKFLNSTPFRTGVDAGLYGYGTRPIAPLTPSPKSLFFAPASQRKRQ